ncbi:MAG: DUF1318 domain-containing protein [Desulfuromonas sp.]|nr:MAG: DUF1318 domain-containing protein [Desulfuromonas sp.]
MTRFFRGTLCLAVLLILSCVTINIYFPAEEIRGAADRIVDEVWGQPKTPDETPATKQPDSGSHWSIMLSTAYAAQDIDVTTPEIRALKNAMKDRADQLLPFLDGGQVGIDRNGMVDIRSTDRLGLKDRAAIKRLTEAENSDRRRLYEEIARANGFPDKADEVRDIFADSWRDKARRGWYVQNDKGAWQRK